MAVGREGPVHQPFGSKLRHSRSPSRATAAGESAQSHTHATVLLQALVHPKVVQERLGYSSIQVTLDVYSHAVPALQGDAAIRFAELIDEAVEPDEKGEL